MSRLNYHHLHYFREVARQGKLTQAAERLRVSQSALSMQIRQLEEDLGQALFVRKGRSLELTEAGRIAYSYAEDIFNRGEELQALLTGGQRPEQQVVRIGAVGTLSRNFQETFVQPLIDREDVHLVLQTGRLEDLLTRLGAHSIDLLLSNQPVQGDDERPWRSHLVAQQAVSVVGRPRRGKKAFQLPDDLREARVIVPGAGSEVRTGFELLCEQWNVHPVVLAEVDDMAMLRLLARDSQAFAILPQVVVRDEIKAGTLVSHATLPGVFERFYAISVRRQFGSPLLQELLARPGDAFLDPEEQTPTGNS